MVLHSTRSITGTLNKATHQGNTCTFEDSSGIKICRIDGPIFELSRMPKALEEKWAVMLQLKTYCSVLLLYAAYKSS